MPPPPPLKETLMLGQEVLKTLKYNSHHDCASGMMSSTTTYTMAPAAKARA